MKKETYDKANKLMAQIGAHKGVVTKLSQKINHPRFILEKDELEKKILERMALISNLRKEFDEL